MHCAGFSAQPIYNSALIATYNVFWTSLPTMAYAILEKDVQTDAMTTAPELYAETMKANWRTFFRSLSCWLSHALVHSMITFALPLYALNQPEPDGKLLGLNAAGVAIYTSIIVTVNLKARRGNGIHFTIQCSPTGRSGFEAEPCCKAPVGVGPDGNVQ